MYLIFLFLSFLIGLKKKKKVASKFIKLERDGRVRRGARLSERIGHIWRLSWLCPAETADLPATVKLASFVSDAELCDGGGGNQRVRISSP